MQAINSTLELPPVIPGMRQRIDSITELPAMPGIAQDLLSLTGNPQANVQDLATIIESDPSIAAQILRYARSAFFGYHGEITSLQQAVTAVLGYGLSLDIAIGLSLGKAFKIPDFGPLGLYPFWRHSVYSAALCQRLSYCIAGPQRPKPGMAFLAGLLHNFGVLLLAHQFRDEAELLAKHIAANEDKSVVDCEHEIIGMDHQEIGAGLLETWNLQEEIVTAVREHHHPQYLGDHARYSRIVLVADRLLKREEIGDAESTELPEELLIAMNLSSEDADTALAAVMKARPDLDMLARQFPA